MTLATIERQVLALIGYDRYSALSVDTNAEKIEDFANLHTCVNLAREEIKLNTTIPSILSRITAIATVGGTRAYNLPSDFDIPLKILYTQGSDEFELEQVYPANLLEKVVDTTAQGTPSWYMILGQSGARVQIEFYNVPSTAGTFTGFYKPVLTEFTTPTNEDVIMKKYPKTVINFATAFAWQIIKKDQTQYDKYYVYGLSECAKIDARETRANSNYKELPNALLRRQRASRLSR